MAPAFLAPAKINLTLEILARRVDGYHGLRSVMVPLDLNDEIDVEPSERFEFSCDDDELQNDDNLVVRALRALGPLPACRVTLRKRIPFGAGLGGGSSDAAAILRAAMTGAFGATSQGSWTEIARALGSDVPFFLAGTGALVEGTGERVTPLGALPAWYALVVTPPVAISTARAYARLDERPPAIRPRSDSVSIAMVSALQRGDFGAVLELVQNDFEPAVAAGSPEITAALAALAAAGARAPRLTGSGSSVFALCSTRAELDVLSGRLVLPPEYRRFATAFAPTPDWRT